VNKHLEQIYSKLGVENRTAAAALALNAIER
jgi:DNA-binding CsgD family transcriptional regulator